MSDQPMTDCGACEGDGGPSIAQPCLACAGSGKVPERIEPTERIERIDPRDFLSPEARAIAHLDLGDTERARACLARVSMQRRRLLGQHFEQLAMMCFAMTRPLAYTPDDQVGPRVRAHPPTEPEHRRVLPPPAAPAVPTAPMIVEVGDLADLYFEDDDAEDTDDADAEDTP